MKQQVNFKTKYIFITGGVLSSLGKGITSASLGYLLQSRGHSVTIQKFDPYLNVDPGTMSPLQHGEVYVTDDGAETDLDLGHYERFLGYSLHRENTCTAGQVYWEVISKERKGSFLGKTVQIVPHITNEIKRRMRIYEGKYEFVIIEIGGTVGDIESMSFLETQRQINYELPRENVLNIHLTYVPYLHASNELKTKPTQHSVHTLMQYGIRPDILLCRTEVRINKEIRQKIGLFCNVDEDSVIEVPDVDTIYEVPLLFKRSGLDETVLRKMNLPIEENEIEEWKKFVAKIKKPANEVTVGLIGKYTQYEDSYKSICEAFKHAGAINNTKVNIDLVNSEELTNKNIREKLSHLSGILVGPGFGNRGIEGKILAVQYARESDIPFFGICLGMQCACIEFARNVCSIENAYSREFEEEGIENSFVIDLMETQKNVKEKGGTMRLGAYPCVLSPNSFAMTAYQKPEIEERHRHRYEFNNAYKEIFSQNGMAFTGMSPNEKLVEIIELPDKLWFVGVQFHPELKSRAVTGHPLFIGFIKAALKKAKLMNKENEN